MIDSYSVIQILTAVFVSGSIVGFTISAILLIVGRY